MTLPSSTEPARLAVVYALTHQTAFPRTIPSAYLFKTAWPADVVQRPVTLKGQPRCFVVAKDDDAGEDSFFLAAGIWRGAVTFAVSLYYYAGSELMKDEADRAMLRIAEDKLRVPACLTAGPALALDPLGNATGLDGDALRIDGYRCIGPNPMPVRNGEDVRVMRVDMSFRTSLELLTPT